MIKTIADLLKALMEEESAVIQKTGIRHAPTIGSMYEGLTSHVLEQILPEGLELSVVAGFAENTKGTLSGQIDCMLVSGTGSPIPHTTLFKWHVRNVIAVFEVKKNLFSAELADSHAQLQKVLHLYWDELQMNRSGSFNVEAAEHAFKQIVGFPAPPRQQLEQLPFDIEMIYRALTVDLVSPVRIAFGYSGYRSEFALRNGFVRFLKANLGKPGFSPNMLPNLVVCGKYTLLKLNGHPYSAARLNDWWPIIASSNENPLIFVLEVIWSRLSERTQMPEWFDQDLGMEKIALLLSCRAVEKGTTSGWEYDINALSKAQLQEAVEAVEWEPHFVSSFQFTIINLLCSQDSIPVLDPLFKGLSADEAGEVDQLLKLRLVGRERDRFVLLTRRCQCLILPDGRFAVADDSSGRFSAWVQRYMRRHK
jgi:hypothetical protein